MNIGIFSGSFNPIHMGHLMLATYLAEYEGFDEVWLVVSPHNPLRRRALPEEDIHRCEMVRLALRNATKVRYNDIEFSLPQPSYTIATLDALRERYPEHAFTLVIGADNWQIFDRWRDYRRIIDEYGVCIYPRRGYDVDVQSLPLQVRYAGAPLIELSSTWIRQGIADGRNMAAFLPAGVYDYICRNHLYQPV